MIEKTAATSSVFHYADIDLLDIELLVCNYKLFELSVSRCH